MVASSPPLLHAATSSNMRGRIARAAGPMQSLLPTRRLLTRLAKSNSWEAGWFPSPDALVTICGNVTDAPWRGKKNADRVAAFPRSKMVRQQVWLPRHVVRGPNDPNGPAVGGHPS